MKFFRVYLQGPAEKKWLRLSNTRGNQASTVFTWYVFVWSLLMVRRFCCKVRKFQASRRAPAAFAWQAQHFAAPGLHFAGRCSTLTLWEVLARAWSPLGPSCFCVAGAEKRREGRGERRGEKGEERKEERRGLKNRELSRNMEETKKQTWMKKWKNPRQETQRETLTSYRLTNSYYW